MRTKILIGALTGLAFISSCSKDKGGELPKASSLNLNITGLEDLRKDYRYEGWLIVDNKPVSTGIFSVDGFGKMTTTSFPVEGSNLEKAKKFVLTIEPYPDSDPAPSATHILAGDFSGDVANLTIGAPEALGNDFMTATGKYVLATPSDGDNNNEKSGLWFLGALPPTSGLQLPTLPSGWRYEGWVVINGQPVTTGTFTNPAAADNFAGYSGTLGTPPFPGEDFIHSAPSTLTFPTDLSGGKTVVSIEPNPDTGAGPFMLKPLLGDIPADAKSHVVYAMNNIVDKTAPKGTAKK